MNAAPVSFALIDDQPAFAGAMAAMLARTGRYTCVGIYPDVATGLAQLPLASPRILLLDQRLPGLSGLEGLPALARLLPRTRILLLTGDDSPELVGDACQANASGFLVKGLPPEHLAALLDRALAGEFVVCGRTARQLLNELRKQAVPDRLPGLLTKRERLVLHSLSHGASYREIAQRERISLETVRTHSRKIFQKLRVRGRTEAVLRFMGELKS